MNIAKLIFNIIAVICIVYAIFRPKDVLSWWWTKSKKVVVGIYKLVKGLIKK